MKALSLLLCFCFTANVLASTLPSSALEEAIDSYMYSVTVEWDQQDSAFKKAQEAELMQKLLLIDSEGKLPLNQIMSVLEKKIANPKLVEALKVQAASMDGSQGPQTILEMLQAQQPHMYSQGASWNGTAVAFYGGIAVIFIALASYSFWFDANYECTEWVSGPRHNTCANWEKQD